MLLNNVIFDDATSAKSLISNKGYSLLTGGNREAAPTGSDNNGQHETEEEATINQVTGGNVSYLLLYFVANEKLSCY